MNWNMITAVAAILIPLWNFRRIDKAEEKRRETEQAQQLENIRKDILKSDAKTDKRTSLLEAEVRRLDEIVREAVQEISRVKKALAAMEEE